MTIPTLQSLLMLIMTRSIIYTVADDCTYKFQVWTPDQDIVRQVRDLEKRYVNITSRLDNQIDKVKLQLLQEIISARNLTSNVELEILQQKLGNSQLNIAIKDNKFEILNIRNDITWLKDKKSKIRDKVPREMKPNVDKELLNTLRNRIGDLKAEWILIKREVHKLKVSSTAGKFTLNDIHRELNLIKKTIAELNEISEKFKTQHLHLQNMNRKLANSMTSINDRLSESTQHNADSITYSDQSKNSGTDYDSLQHRVAELESELKGMYKDNKTSPRRIYDDKRISTAIPKDCDEIYKEGGRTNSIYQIQPTGAAFAENVYCEMLNGRLRDVQTYSGWIIIQRRIDGSTNFNKNWVDYKFGFGNPYGELWAGNDLIHLISKQGTYRLRIDMWDWSGWKVFADYDNFRIDSEIDNYKLHIHKHKGDAGDSLSYHDGMSFSTKDKDNDLHRRNCALDNNSGWWFNSCYSANLNGVYRNSGWYAHTSDNFADGVVWYTWKVSEFYSLKRVEMKISRMK